MPHPGLAKTPASSTREKILQQLGSLPDRELEKIGKNLKIETSLQDEDTLDKALLEEKKPKIMQQSKSGIITKENLERFNEVIADDEK